MPEWTTQLGIVVSSGIVFNILKKKGAFMLEEEKKHYFRHALCTFLAALIGGFLAFYVVMDITLSRMLDPMRSIKRAEKMMMNQAREMKRLDNDVFMPAPMPLHHSIITMLRDDNMYKFVIDLKQLDNNEKNVEVTINDDTVNIKGAVEKMKGHENSIVEFSQTFALGQKIEKSKVTKERKGDKYIVIVPVEGEN